LNHAHVRDLKHLHATKANDDSTSSFFMLIFAIHCMPWLLLTVVANFIAYLLASNAAQDSSLNRIQRMLATHTCLKQAASSSSTLSRFKDDLG